MNLQQNVADTMRMLKEQHHMSMAEFSEELEISRSTLQDYLNGTGNPSVVMLEHIAEKMNVDPILLITGSIEPSNKDLVLLMFRTTQAVISLPERKRRYFAELFLEIVSLWDSEVMPE